MNMDTTVSIDWSTWASKYHKTPHNRFFVPESVPRGRGEGHGARYRIAQFLEKMFAAFKCQSPAVLTRNQPQESQEVILAVS